MASLNPHRINDTVYMTAYVKKYLLRYSEEIRNALNQFRHGEYGNVSEKPTTSLIDRFGSYELPFGTVWIIDYKLFSDRDFITVLLPCEYDENT